MTEDDTPTLRCTCEDYDDFFANDFMGFVEFDIRKYTHRRHRDWYDLLPDPKKPKEQVSGKLEIVLRWVAQPGVGLGPFLDSTDVDDVSRTSC